MPHTILFIGPPGCGKGTHASRLSEEFEIIAISVGELLRQAVKAGTDTGRKIADLMAQGRLVPDETALEVVEDTLASHRDCDLLFDGFPRSLNQARLLDRILPDYHRKADIAVLFRVSDQEVIRRISGRRMDPATGRIYHVEFNPPPPDVETVQRDDDREDVVRQRLEIYHTETAPVADYYRQKGNLKEIDGEGSADQVYQRVVEALKPLVS